MRASTKLAAGPASPTSRCPNRRLRSRDGGSGSFEDLVGHRAAPIEVVVGLLAVLELYKRSLVELDQASTFGDIAVRWTGGDLVDPADLAVEEPA